MSQNVRELIELGKEHFERREYHLAERYLRQVIESSPKFADVHNLLGVTSHIAGRFQAAIDHFKSALKINPRYTEAMLNLAVLYNDLGQYKDAKLIYTQLKKNTGKNTHRIEPVLKGKLSNLHAEIGDIYRSISLFDYAQAEYEKALELNPNYHDIRTKLGRALRESGQLDEALLELQTVVKKKKKYVPALVQLGVTYYSQGNIREAKKAWNDALKINPHDQYANMYLRLCKFTEKQQKPKKAAAKTAKKAVSKKTTKKTSKKKVTKKAAPLKKKTAKKKAAAKKTKKSVTSKKKKK